MFNSLIRIFSREKESSRLYKRIVHLIYQDGEGGGPVSVLAHMKWYFREYDIVFLHGGTGRVEEYCTKENIRSIRLPIDKIWKCAFGWIPLLFWLIKLKPDLLILHGQWAGPLGALTGKLAGLRRMLYIAHWPSFYTDWDLYRVIRNRIAEAIPVILCDRTVCLSPENFYQYYIRFPKEAGKLIQLSNANDDGVLPSAESRDKLKKGYCMEDRHLHVVSVARLASQKNISWLLRSWVSVQECVPEARLWIVGTGEEEEKLRTLAEELGITETCTFLGSQKHGIQFVDASDIVAATTLYEAHSHSVLEALRCGKPIVANDADGVRCSIRDGEEGFLVQLGDVVTFSDRLVQLCQSKELRERMGELGRKSAQRFELAQVMPQYTTIIKELIAE